MTVTKRNDSTTYRSQVRVPKDLIAHYGKTHIFKALGKVSHRDAVAADRVHEGEMALEFERVRRELKGETILTPYQAITYARDLVRSWFEDMEEDEPLDERGIMDIHSSAHHYVPLIINLVPTRYTKLNANDVAQVQRSIEDAFNAECLERLNVGTPAPFIAPVPPPPAKPATPFDRPETQQTTYNLGDKGPITLEKAVELLKKSEWWLGHPPKTVLNYQRTFPLLFILFGKDRLMHTISPEDITWLRKMIDGLPVGFSDKGKVADIVNAIKAREQGLKAPEAIASATKNKHHTVIQHLFSTLKAKWYLKFNIGEDLQRWSNNDRKYERVAFTNDEIVNIIGKAKEHPTTSHLFWIPQICAYTGARRGELCQLTPADIVKHDGVWSFFLREDEEDQSLKNQFSQRIVPIHSRLISMGFLQYVDSNQSNANGRLWGSLHHNVHGWGDAFGKAFGKMIKGTFTLGEKQMKDFHSLRHSVTTYLIDKVDYGVLDSVLGWSSEERKVLERTHARKLHTRDNYSKSRKPIEELQEAIELIKW